MRRDAQDEGFASQASVQIAPGTGEKAVDTERERRSARSPPFVHRSRTPHRPCVYADKKHAEPRAPVLPARPTTTASQIKKRKCVPCGHFFDLEAYERHINTELCIKRTKAYYEERQLKQQPPPPHPIPNANTKREAAAEKDTTPVDAVNVRAPPHLTNSDPRTAFHRPSCVFSAF